MEISHANNEYGRRFHDMFGHLWNIARCMEDLSIYSAQHLELQLGILNTAGDHNVDLQHESEFQIAREELLNYLKELAFESTDRTISIHVVRPICMVLVNLKTTICSNQQTATGASRVQLPVIGRFNIRSIVEIRVAMIWQR